MCITMLNNYSVTGIEVKESVIMKHCTDKQFKIPPKNTLKEDQNKDDLLYK